MFLNEFSCKIPPKKGTSGRMRKKNPEGIQKGGISEDNPREIYKRTPRI